MNNQHRDMLKTLMQENWHQQCPVTLVGAAIMDMVAHADALPERGGDVAASVKGFHLGGCALNIALGLKQLGIKSSNLLPIGEGMWSNRLREEMAKRGIESDLSVSGGDNGWCLALVEPDGERTFISIDGIENEWQPEWLVQSTPQTGLVYVSGYQLGAKKGGVLVEWLQQLPAAVRVVVDFGPRLDTMSPELINALIRPGVILTLNQREANLLGMHDDVEAFSQQLHEKTQELVVIRCGEKGSYYYGGEQDHSWIAAKKVQMVDSIGAGDSHCAGLLAGLSLGLSHWQSMMLANSVAGYVVSQAGGDCAPTIAQLFEKDFL
ncbi:PfkB family carbohydrate kinase [Rouxiella sp. Mn2063]|uniref:PfkB family carbohydrate kinase n=1 Tax=Rouxiella sp. Mn2063 TaxID=3395262 RepID=UPI003BD39FB7